jgi:hypothetical protein
VKPRIDKAGGGASSQRLLPWSRGDFARECARAHLPLKWDQILRLFQKHIFSVALPQAEDSADFGPMCGLAAILGQYHIMHVAAPP